MTLNLLKIKAKQDIRKANLSEGFYTSAHHSWHGAYQCARHNFNRYLNKRNTNYWMERYPNLLQYAEWVVEHRNGE